jgi:general secretion pathway protein F
MRRRFWRGPADAGVGRGQALSKQDLTDVTRELSLMLGAGQDLDRALRFLLQSAVRPRLRKSLERIRDAVRDGAPLASAMALQPRSFPRLYVGLVRAGEAGGTLAATLDQTASLLERERALAANIQSALIYPAMLVLVAIASVALLLTQVLPQFVPLFEQNAAALPGPTQALITAGDLVSAYGIAGLLALLLAGLLLRVALLRNSAFRTMWDRWLLRLPVIGALAQEVLAARFTRTLGTLLTNGVALVGALAIARETLGNLAAVAALDRATLEVKGGGSLARALAPEGVFPQRTVHLLQLGEEAELGPMALRAAEIHEEKSRVGLQRLVSLLVPVITIVMGAVVAGIVSALLLAMLSLNDLAS